MQSSDDSELGTVSYGCVMAMLGSFFAGSSMVLQKVGVRKSRRTWWLGIVCLILGELLTVIAYTNAPAVLVSPLGALRVIVTTLLSVHYLKEKITTSTKLGIAISILGSILIIIHAPRKSSVTTFEELRDHLKTPEFILFLSTLALSVTLIYHFFMEKYGKTNVFVYIGICDILGCIGVLLSKGIGIVIGSILSGNVSYLFDVISWLVVGGVVGGAIAQLHFLNLSLKNFDASVIAPLKYVGTNVLVVVGSCILYKELTELSFGNICGLLSGFGIVMIGTFYVHGVESTSRKVRSLSQTSLKTNKDYD
jgi:uncharacterized membrane protein